MRTQPHPARTAFRRAVWASVALHVVAAAGLLLLVHTNEKKPRVAAIDTRAPHVQMHLIETVTEVEVRPEPLAPASAIASEPKEVPQPPPPAGSEPLHTGPFATPPPRTLPPELVALLRKPGTMVAPAPVRDPNVRPAGANGAAPASTGRAMHGALKPAQTVVYILDCSGSMGAAGKLAVAHTALTATLAQQPATVRFQVIVYDGTARPLAPGGAAPATRENIDAATAKLAAIEPRGKSNHRAALRAALDLRPDVVVWLTDASDLTAAEIKPVLKAAGRPVPVCVGLVTAEGVQQPRELK